MNKHVTTVLIVLLLGGIAVAKYTPKSKTPAKPPPDYCKDTIDPYRPFIQKSRFFQAAGADNELTESEFNVSKAKRNGFVRPFDSWKALVSFDKDHNKTIDWIEADAYRYDLRKRVLAAYDANADNKLKGSERTRANTDLARGRIASPPKSSSKSPPTRTAHRDSPRQSGGDDAEIARLKGQLYGIRKKLYYSPALAESRKAAESADRAYESAKRSRVIADARKPYDAARHAYERIRDRLPEARMYEKVKKAYYDACGKTPEYKAYSAARDALRRAGRDREAYARAKSSYERAKNTYDAQKTKIPEYKDYEDARRARDKAAGSTGEYKDFQDAEKTYRQTYEKHLAGQQKARENAQKARDAKLDELLKADPGAREIYGRIKKLEAKRK